MRSFLSRWFEPNPVFKRELRARWRRPAAYLTLFFYAAPLALGMTLFYDATMDVTLLGDIALADVGKRMFNNLLGIQVVLWLFIGAITAAPAIAGERERGLLEALQLANLSARRIVAGKCLSLFSFELLLFLVPLPVLAICFLLGGVEPQEFLFGALTVAVSALCGTAIGLYFSSLRPRPGAALRDTMIFLVVWTALALLSSAAHTNLGWPLMLRRLMALLELIHPIGGLMWLGGEEFHWPARAATEQELSRIFGGPWLMGMGGLRPLFDTISSEVAWQWSIAGLLALTILFFILALCGTARVFVEGELMQRRPLYPFKWKQIKPVTVLPTSITPSLPRREGALFLSLPLLSNRSFDNPVFGRELRGKTRWRAATPMVWLGRALLLLLLAGGFFYALHDLVDDNSYHAREEALRYLVLLYLASLCLYASVSGATSFTREHESNTWESLRLSLLTAGQILQGKVWPLFIALTALCAPLLLMLGTYANLQPLLSDPDYSYNSPPEFYLWQAVAATVVTLSTALACGCIAMFISWLSRTSQVALGLSIGVNAAWLFLFLIIANFVRRDYEFQHYLSWWNPPAALATLTRSTRFFSSDESLIVLQIVACGCAFFMVGVAVFFVLVVSGLMRQRFRDEKV